YPTIFSFALDILPIQGTAVPSEHVFSSGKETDTLQRNRLGVDAMEASNSQSERGRVLILRMDWM
ncbi:hypothetical protein ARMGADRAFT_951248, partial [Armillaria gallica]